MRNLKCCFNFTSNHDTCMTLPRHWCHGQNFKKNGGLDIKHDTMTLFPVKLLYMKKIFLRARVYRYSIIFFNKKRKKYKETLKKSAMTLFKKSIMQVSWQCHGVMAESLLAVVLQIFLAGLIAWRVSGGAAC